MEGKVYKCVESVSVCFLGGKYRPIFVPAGQRSAS